MPRRSFPFALIVVVAIASTARAQSQRAWLDRLPPDAEAWSLRRDTFEKVVDAVALPGADAVRGVGRLGDAVWLARGDELLAFDLASGEVARRAALPAGLLGLSADERFLYVLRADAVDVFDGTALQTVRQLPLGARADDARPCAIACHGAEVVVAWPERMVAIDARSGAVRELPKPERRLQWLASDGRRLWGGDAAGAARVRGVRSADDDGPSPGVFGWPCRAQRSAAVWIGERLLLAVDYQDAKRQPQHAAGFVQPEPELAAERLSLKVQATGKGVKYEVGPKPLQQLDQLQRELQRIAQNPAAMVPGPDGKRVLMPVVLEAYPGVRIKDLAAAWDAAIAAGFVTVYCEQAEVAGPRGEPPPPPRGDGR